MNRAVVQRTNYLKLFVASILVSLFCALLAFSLKHITELLEESIFEFAQMHTVYLFLILPSVGITIIFFLRKYLFKKRRNKGITEIYKTLYQRKDHLPLFKIPSHYLNGFLTVIFGGSTGIEVSTVVASATAGNYAYEKHFSANSYKLELICAGVTAGIAILFNSPIGGMLFACEVIARKWNRTLILACVTAAATSFVFLYLNQPHRILTFQVKDWKWSAVPFFILLSLISGALSVYFTTLVIRIKEFFSGINNSLFRVNLGALGVGLLLFLFPALYGDSYHGIATILTSPESFSIITLLLIILLKPLASAVTLGAGGDGGVFAPSIVAGGVLGVVLALFCNTYLGTSFVYLNFALIGAASTLAASIYAPLTALFLICNLAPNGFTLFIPLLVCSFVATLFAKRLLPYNVYTYQPK